VQNYYDPLLKQYFGNNKLNTFKEKDKIRDAFQESRDNRFNKGEETSTSKQVVQSNTNEYHKLVEGLKLKKVLVGSHNRKPFYALIDSNHRVCLPYQEEVVT